MSKLSALEGNSVLNLFDELSKDPVIPSISDTRNLSDDFAGESALFDAPTVHSLTSGGPKKKTTRKSSLFEKVVSGEHQVASASHPESGIPAKKMSSRKELGKKPSGVAKGSNATTEDTGTIASRIRAGRKPTKRPHSSGSVGKSFFSKFLLLSLLIVFS